MPDRLGRLRHRSLAAGLVIASLLAGCVSWYPDRFPADEVPHDYSVQKGRVGRYDSDVLILHPSDFGQPDHYEGLLGRRWCAWTDTNYELGDYPYPIRVIVYHHQPLHDIKMQYPSRTAPPAEKKPKTPALPDTRYVSFQKAMDYFDRYLAEVESENLPEKNRILLSRLRITRRRLINQWEPSESLRIERLNKYPHLRMGWVDSE